jgi:hypothetical protein
VSETAEFDEGGEIRPREREAADRRRECVTERRSRLEKRRLSGDRGDAQRRSAYQPAVETAALHVRRRPARPRTVGHEREAVEHRDGEDQCVDDPDLRPRIDGERVGVRVTGFRFDRGGYARPTPDGQRR